MSRDNLSWLKRERVACGPGSNRIRAKARKAAKAEGNRSTRRKKMKGVDRESNQV